MGSKIFKKIAEVLYEYSQIDMMSVRPSLVSSVDVLLLEAEDDGAEVVVVGEVVPVLRPVKVLLVSLVLHRCQTELTELQSHRTFWSF